MARLCDWWPRSFPHTTCPAQYIVCLTLLSLIAAMHRCCCCFVFFEMRADLSFPQFAVLRREKDQRDSLFSVYIEIVGIKVEQRAHDMPTLLELSIVSLGDDFGACLFFHVSLAHEFFHFYRYG